MIAVVALVAAVAAVVAVIAAVDAVVTAIKIWYTGVVKHSELIHKHLFYKNPQVGVTSKVLHQFLPKFVFRGSWVF